MKLTHIPGVNCYLDCVITLADTFGIDYAEAFSCLWPESELCYEAICHTFLSRGLFRELDAMGMGVGKPCVSRKDKEQGWAECAEGEFMIVGIDGFSIPWNPLFSALHGPHYLIVHKSASEPQVCCDPTYGIRGQKLTSVELIAASYAIIPVRQRENKIAYERGDRLLVSQAEEVMKAHPLAARRFLEKAKTWIQKGEENAFLPARYVEALTEGRRLYGFVLRKRKIPPNRAPLFWSESFFKQWRAVKNGFNKAALTKQKDGVFDETCCLFMSLYEQEIKMAEQILDKS
ncbi:hypothetical protein [Luxibacter massiliensis]|uniref:hypothetical protein n=1 Tax=Luxibacter massiliensis TaxID=2219695 RepID=UPI000F05B2E4|nr:hypothetical protein [Luxibacter massiliensis]